MVSAPISLSKPCLGFSKEQNTGKEHWKLPLFFRDDIGTAQNEAMDKKGEILRCWGPLY